MDHKIIDKEKEELRAKNQALVRVLRDLERWGFSHDADVRAKAIKALQEAGEWPA